MHRGTRLILALALVLGIVVLGTLGFSLIEGWSLPDSLYMAVITVSTVGFGEVRSLSSQGRLLTVGLIVVAVATIGYSVTTLIAYVFEGQFLDDWRRRRMTRDIGKLSNHAVICGAGKFGREVAAEFARSGVPYVVIDRDPDHSELAGTFADGALYVAGDCEDDATLLQAGVDRARGLISALPEDDSNVFVALTARQLNPGLVIISQAAEERSIRKLRLAGADQVVSPYRSAGRRMASLLIRPSVVNFIEEALDVEQTAMQIDQVAVVTGSTLVGRELRASRVGDATGAVILAIHGPDGTRVNPTGASTLGSTVLGADDVLVAVGTEEQLQALRRFASELA